MSYFEIVVLILIAIVAGMLVYIAFLRLRVRKDIARESKRVREDTDREIGQRTESLLRLAAIPFLWAIRTELQRSNYAQIEEYFNLYVKEEGISQIALIDTADNITLATDKKWEGKPFSSVFPKEDIRGLRGIEVHHRPHDDKYILAPITEINEKLGTVLIVYHAKDVRTA